jgi:hypothetical protein
VSQSRLILSAISITVLVDRWRLETHTFQLRIDEMTPTLWDVFIILGLPIDHEPLCMRIDSDGRR